jgi:hypothetical protein
MTKFLFVEDAFVKFYDLVVHTGAVLPQDLPPCFSFYEKITINEKLTENQGRFLLKILSKYNEAANSLELNYNNILDNPIWKNDFRVIDLSKQVFVEVHDKSTEICLKFPFSIKSAFEKEIDQFSTISRWDHDRKVRVINLIGCNVIQIYEFCCRHGFEIDDSFMALVSQVEEVWNNQESIVCYSNAESEVVLKNAPDSAIEYFKNNSSQILEQDMFLAKSMGYPVRLKTTPLTHFEKICSTTERTFWLKSTTDFFEVYKKIGGTVAVLLDRNTADIKEWLADFVSVSEKYISKEFVKVCFREDKSSNSLFNQWVKDSGLGGKVEDGKILIFLHKPPKWLFSKEIDVKLIVTNSYTPLNEPMSAAWINHHPCVIYVGNIKPTPTRNKQFVNL